MQIEYANMLKWFHYNNPDQMGRFVESVSKNQQHSKDQLFFGLKEKNIVVPTDENGDITIEIVGGWFGWPLIGTCIRAFDNIKKINFYDIDPFACRVLHRYIEEFKPSIDINVFNSNWLDDDKERRAHVIINTSCEHMKDFKYLRDRFVAPERTLLMLTSNDKIDELDHINCKSSANQLAADNGVHMLHGDHIWFEDYRRFIVVGKWK